MGLWYLTWYEWIPIKHENVPTKESFNDDNDDDEQCPN